MYQIYFSKIKHDAISVDQVIHLNILPEKLNYKGGKDNKLYDVLSLGEVVKPGRRKLRTWQLHSEFTTDDEESIDFYRTLFRALAESPEPFQMDIIRKQADGSEFFGDSVWVVLEDYEFEERAGEMETLYYQLKLQEYVGFATQAVNTDGGVAFVRLVPEDITTAWKEKR